MNAEIPDKLYFKIGEVAEITGIKAHVLRYWEAEFPVFSPQKSRSNQRLYRRRDIETALLIKDLLHRQRLTIAGAKKILNRKTAGGGASPPPVQSAKNRRIVDEIRRDLVRLRDSLSSTPDPY